MRGSTEMGLLKDLLVLVLAIFFQTKSTVALLVQRPCCSAYAHAGASFGPQLPWVAPGVMGTLSRGQDKECNGATPNSIVMIDRGMESFVDAVKACQEKGVVAVVVRNVASSSGGENDLIVMGSASGESGVHVPSVFVSRKTGDELDAMLAMNPTVFVQLFAADDINSLMAYLAYLVMSVETMFFFVVFFSIVFIISSRRMIRKNRCRNRRCCCRRNESESSRVALIINDRSLIEPLQPNNTNQLSNAVDPESKPPKERNGSQAVHAYPIVYANGISQDHTVHLRVDPDNEEPLFEQQEQ